MSMDPASAAIGAAGGVVGSIISAASASHSAYKAYKYSKKLQQNQYDLNRQALREQYQNSRYSLEQAGYNPLLAVGSSAQGVSTGATQSPSENVDGVGVVNSALNAMQTKAQVENTKANTSLQNQQAETEKSKRVQMEFENARNEVETKLRQKDLDSYDERFYRSMQEMIARTDNLRVSSAVSQMDAETNRINAETNKQGNPFKLSKDLIESSDPYKWMSRTYRKYFPKKY
ncbi:DNA pilot protein [Peromfec virus RodF7_10]|uniref:DNA pilot protein n=1 Tax=Peromfec virus RodF7_10 TaxID=2929346 RepID=A0A976N232_9VIRU|nr:DNA pilot protein [Peromfec virus RodF7_10]